TVKGLKQLFPGKVEVYTLDPDSTKRRGVRDAQELYLSYEQVEVEDIKLCNRELGLSEAALDNANILFSELGKSWIIQLLNMSNEDIEMFCAEKRGHKGSIMSLQRKLLRLDSLKYMRSAC
ncbi:MAG: ATPase, partial [Dolichospermum sp.]